jgi:hypothetical protein
LVEHSVEVWKASEADLDWEVVLGAVMALAKEKVVEDWELLFLD